MPRVGRPRKVTTLAPEELRRAVTRAAMTLEAELHTYYHMSSMDRRAAEFRPLLRAVSEFEQARKQLIERARADGTGGAPAYDPVKSRSNAWHVEKVRNV